MSAAAFRLGFPAIEENFMSKTNAEALLRKMQRQVANTSGGGHLGGTNFGQGNDAKTSSGSGNRPAGKGRPPSGGKR
jgi:hypothetical protein